jgi:hypothetical protein
MDSYKIEHMVDIKEAIASGAPFVASEGARPDAWAVVVTNGVGQVAMVSLLGVLGALIAYRLGKTLLR